MCCPSLAQHGLALKLAICVRLCFRRPSAFFFQESDRASVARQVEIIKLLTQRLAISTRSTFFVLAEVIDHGLRHAICGVVR